MIHLHDFRSRQRIVFDLCTLAYLRILLVIHQKKPTTAVYQLHIETMGTFNHNLGDTMRWNDISNLYYLTPLYGILA